MSRWKPKDVKTMKTKMKDGRTTVNACLREVVENNDKLGEFLKANYSNPLHAALALQMARWTTLNGVEDGEDRETIFKGISQRIIAILFIGEEDVLASMKDGTYEEKYEEMVEVQVDKIRQGVRSGTLKPGDSIAQGRVRPVVDPNKKWN